ncbi:hypothetical protein LTR95_000976 [Oleoguttula sp. CCFEE 5521]
MSTPGYGRPKRGHDSSSSEDVNEGLPSKRPRYGNSAGEVEASWTRTKSYKAPVTAARTNYALDSAPRNTSPVPSKPKLSSAERDALQVLGLCNMILQDRRVKWMTRRELEGALFSVRDLAEPLHNRFAPINDPPHMTFGPSNFGEFILAERIEKSYCPSKLRHGNPEWVVLGNHRVVRMWQPALVMHVWPDGMGVEIRYISTLSNTENMAGRLDKCVPVYFKGEPTHVQEDCFDNGSTIVRVDPVPDGQFVWLREKCGQYLAVHETSRYPNNSKRAVIGHLEGDEDWEAVRTVVAGANAVTSHFERPQDLPERSRESTASKPMPVFSDTTMAPVTRALPVDAPYTYQKMVDPKHTKLIEQLVDMLPTASKLEEDD